MPDTLFGVMKKKIETNVEDVKEAIVSGSVKDYSEYMHMRGIVRGLRTAHVILSDMEKDQFEDNDDD